MTHYDPKDIEKKWQDKWDSDGTYRADDASKKPKFYALIEFPFPSGDGMHTGHLRSNTAMDIVSRKRRMQGFEVLYPIGWDAFGLPTENYAIKTGKQPALVTKENTDNFRRQLKSAGFSFDWSREVNTTDPKYYKWTQWIFLKLHEKGLAYKKKMTINWCPKDKIGLANEEVIDGSCERCGTATEKREKEQWMLAITKYADRLDSDLDTVDFVERVKVQQRNWIGKSEGAELSFKVSGTDDSIKVFTTRADTLFGVSYVVLAPEHPLTAKLSASASNKTDIDAYVAQAKKKEDFDRTGAKEKTGVEIKGVTATNPANGESVPVWVADYVLASYGTGAVMAVPAHDERDFEFAKKYGLPVKEVVIPHKIDKRNPPVAGKKNVERRNVHVIVRNPADGKVLILKWKQHAWTTFPMGGIEDGEDVIEAAKREVLEETGYKNLINGKVWGGPVKAEYFAAHKDENRVAFTNLVTFDLANLEKETLSESEAAQHEVVWADMKTLTQESMTHSEMGVWLDRLKGERVYAGEGILTASGAFDGLPSGEAAKKVAEAAGGRMVTTYKLRDWIFSRQRYWGEPIPMVNCGKCGWVPVPEKDLPVVLPEVENYQPTDDGESPLSKVDSWVNVPCPSCKGPAKRETDTMPNWAGSSWYYLRYADPKNDSSLADMAKLKRWTPVDWYNGGMEHTTLHLLYSRFWHKFLFDIGIVPTSEPYMKRTSHGFILAENNEKMSKSRGNVVNPDKIIETFGADTLRVYEMFAAPFEQAFAWSTDGIVGPRRFIERVWKLKEKVSNDTDTLSTKVHKAVKKVGEDIENMSFNTAVSTLMILVNDMEKVEAVSKESYGTLLKLVAPFAPHVTEELWSSLGNSDSIHVEMWPEYDPSKLTDSEVTIAVQVNGKVRAQFTVSADTDDEKVKNMALDMDETKKWTAGKEVKKVVYVKGKIVSIVVG